MYRILIIVAILTSCSDESLVLSGKGKSSTEKKDQSNSDIASDGINREKKRKTVETRKVVFDFFDGKNQYLFHNLSSAPSYALSLDETKTLNTIIEFMNSWEMKIFQSLDEYDTASFMASLLNSSEKESSAADLLQKIRNYTLPLFALKSIPSSHKPTFKEKDFRALVKNLYSKGYNLRHTTQKDLDLFLTALTEIVWNGRRNGIVEPKNSIELLKSIQSKLSRDQKNAFRRMINILSKKIKPSEEHFDIARYRLYVKPIGDDFRLWLTFNAESKRFAFDLFQKTFIDTAQNYFPQTKYTLEDKKYSDEYLIRAAGPCSMCIKREIYPGSEVLPGNIYNTDWRKTGIFISKLIFSENEAKNFHSCYSGMNELLTEMDYRIKDAVQLSSDNLKTRTFHKDYDDSEIIKTIWRRIVIQLIMINHSVTGFSQKSGCEKTPIQYWSYRYLIRRSISETSSLDIVADEALIRLVLGLREIKRAEGNPQATPWKNVKNFFHEDVFPEAFKNSELTTAMKALMEIIVSPTPDRLKALMDKMPKPAQFLSSDELIEIKRKYMEALPFVRFYMPAQMRVVNGRVTYRHSIDAVDYYLDFYPRISGN